MKRILSFVGVAVAAFFTGCTLLLPTQDLVTPCAEQADCDEAVGEGFVCEDNACLPEDEDPGASG